MLEQFRIAWAQKQRGGRKTIGVEITCAYLAILFKSLLI